MYDSPIVLRNITKNNLKHVSLDLPKGELIAFTGVSGSGKSSLIFDTIAKEAQRQFNETLPMYLRNKMEQFELPEAEEIKNLTPTVVIDQKPLAGNIRSTVATATDTAPLLRLLFSRIGQPSAGYSNAYSFNDPIGACPVCDGLGEKLSLDLDKLFDSEKSLEGGAIRFQPFSPSNWQFMLYKNSGLFDLDKPLKDFTKKEWHDLLYGKDLLIQIAGPTSDYRDKGHKYEGMVDRFNRLYINRDISGLSKKVQSEVEKVLSVQPCPHCHGARLNDKALASKINGYNIAEMSDMEITNLIPVMRDIHHPKGKSILPALLKHLQNLLDVGLGYIQLSRQTSSLSGGEAQRVKMVRHLGSDLSNLTYILDEPSIGLHPHDVSRLIGVLKELRDKGNTILVVEHERFIIEQADRIINIGPGAGEKGGNVDFQGSYPELLASDTLTGQYLKQPLKTEDVVREPNGFYSIDHLSVHNLKDVSVKVPKGVLTSVTGVAGSGKSTLIKYGLADVLLNAIVVTQSSIGTSQRSTPATYVGVMDDIRKLFAKEFDVPAGMFSFNSIGACPVCDGKGYLKPDMAFADPIALPCEACGGTRYNEEARSYKIEGKNIVDILQMTVDESLEYFKPPKVLKKICTLSEVGVGYLTLGQPTSTLSGGEAQRIKLASELHKNGRLYLLDEPATGLHPADIENLLALLNQLVDRGNTVVVIEHDLQMIAQSDWILDMGPEGGKNGGKVLYNGPIAEFLKTPDSYTAEYLKSAIREE